jgi:hypothetical protein
MTPGLPSVGDSTTSITVKPKQYQQLPTDRLTYPSQTLQR